MERYISIDNAIKIAVKALGSDTYTAIYISTQLEQAPADVVPRSEFERLRQKYNLAVSEREANVKGFTEQLARLKTEVAREIFAEIDSMCIDIFGNFNHRRFIEIKRKYTGGRTMKTTLESVLEHFKHEYRKLLDNFGIEKHPEKIAMYKIVIEIIEKFIPKEPKKEGLADWYCPACKAWIKFDSLNMPIEHAPKRCESCGQVLDWRK